MFQEKGVRADYCNAFDVLHFESTPPKGVGSYFVNYLMRDTLKGTGPDDDRFWILLAVERTLNSLKSAPACKCRTGASRSSIQLSHASLCYLRCLLFEFASSTIPAASSLRLKILQKTEVTEKLQNSNRSKRS